MIKKTSKKESRQSRHMRIRKKISGTGEIPRLCIYTSLQHIYAQIIDDEQNVEGRDKVVTARVDQSLKVRDTA